MLSMEVLGLDYSYRGSSQSGMAGKSGLSLYLAKEVSRIEHTYLAFLAADYFCGKARLHSMSKLTKLMNPRLKGEEKAAANLQQPARKPHTKIAVHKTAQDHNQVFRQPL